MLPFVLTFPLHHLYIAFTYLLRFTFALPSLYNLAFIYIRGILLNE